MAGGRPSEYTDKIANNICTRIARGESVHSFAGTNGLPVEDTIYRWVFEKPEFSEKYLRAREIQAERGAGNLRELSRRALDLVQNCPDPKLASALVAAVKLERDTEMWIASKLLPKKYGDKLQHTGSDGEGPVQFVVTRAGSKEKDHG